MQLAPFEYFTIVRQIEDPLDLVTYYPQAEIRNARTDALLDTVDLESKGDGRYSERWQVPADVSGAGFYVTIISKVYTDSAHTTESDNYGRKEQTFLVRDRHDNLGGSGGISYNDVKEALKKVLSDYKFPVTKETDLRPLLKAIKEVPIRTARQIDIPEVEIPEQKAVDFTPVLKAIQKSSEDITKAVANIEIPKYQEHLRVITELIKTLDNKLTKAEIQGALKLLPELNAEIAKLPEYMEKVEQSQQLLRDNLMTVRGLFGAPESKLDRSTLPSRLRSVLKKKL
jgi:hypothetical protein